MSASTPATFVMNATYTCHVLIVPSFCHASATWMSFFRFWFSHRRTHILLSYSFCLWLQRGFLHVDCVCRVFHVDPVVFMSVAISCVPFWLPAYLPARLPACMLACPCTVETYSLIVDRLCCFVKYFFFRHHAILSPISNSFPSSSR